MAISNREGMVDFGTLSNKRYKSSKIEIYKANSFIRDVSELSKKKQDS